VKLDTAAKIELDRQGLTFESIPELGRQVLVRRTGDLTTDCTDEVHELTAAQAVLAAQVVGLDVAGLDVLAENISEPLAPQRGAVVEVNAGPSLSSHVVPMFGKPQPVGEAVIDMLFPASRNARIAIHGLLVASYDESCTDPIENWIVEQESKNLFAGVVLPDAIRIRNQTIELEDYSSRLRALAVLSHPQVESLLVVLLPTDLLSHGLPVGRLDHVAFVEGAIESIRASGTQEVFKVLRNAMPEQARPDWLRAI
jgi:cyanophycin synthetase